MVPAHRGREPIDLGGPFGGPPPGEPRGAYRSRSPKPFPDGLIGQDRSERARQRGDVARRDDGGGGAGERAKVSSGGGHDRGSARERLENGEPEPFVTGWN